MYALQQQQQNRGMQQASSVAAQEGSNMLLKYSPAPQDMTPDAHASAKQLALLNDRNPIVKAAVEKEYDMSVAEDGYEFSMKGRHGRQYTVDGLLSGDQLLAALNEAEVKSPDVRSGGLIGLLSDETLFWSVIHSWHGRGTIHSPKWDGILARAKKNRMSK